MPLGFDAFKDVLDTPARRDDESNPGCTPEFEAKHTLFLPDAVELADSVIGIRKQRKVEPELFDEFLDAENRIGADSDDGDLCILVLSARIAESAGLFGATGRVGFRIKVEDDALLCGQLA